MNESNDFAEQITEHMSTLKLEAQTTLDDIPTYWIHPHSVTDVLGIAKRKIKSPYVMLYDLTAVDERERTHRAGQPQSDFTLVYHLYSFEQNRFVRIKTPLLGENPSAPSITGLWACADWYEREVFDMFGIHFSGHPDLRRILMPPTWTGHPLRKEYPARATEKAPFELNDEQQSYEQEALRLRPEQYELKPSRDGFDTMFLNLGPQHPGTHGVLRAIVQLEGEEIVDTALDIGYHHRGAEKMAERQTWHTYIPYTDRIDYLGGVMNNFPYCLAVETLAGIQVPPRAQIIRVMLAELYRIASHLVWYGTFAQDVGALSPVFYMFSDREKIFTITEAICGGRMHPSWFRIGGVADDLPEGWKPLVEEFLDTFPKKIDEYDRLVMRNRIFKARTQGIGSYTKDQAIEWGVTGPGLRACGLEWDFRKKMPYSGYDQLEFDIPIAQKGDCYDRALVRVEEMRQSLKIIRQCINHMPEGPIKADHPLTTPPRKAQTMRDIETLINHFLSVSWGPVIPAGEALVCIEATKGNNGYYLISDGDTHAYRARIRTPSFPHLQAVPAMSRGHLLPDLLAILGSIDFVLADVDR